MIDRLALIVGFGLLIVLYESTQAALPEKAFLVVNGAENVEEYQGNIEGRSQVSYSVTLEYPRLAIGEFQRKELKKFGWARCTAKKTGWEIFSDLASGNDRTVYRHMDYWAKDNRLITISLNYYSLPQEQTNCAKPDNNTQHVVILFDSYDDIEGVKKRLGLLCRTD